jgi:ATP-dependent DNA helicase RecQ
MPTALPRPLKDAIQKHWGFRGLRPLQAEAMLAALDGRDSLVVMPTGGGKSLCYQAPAVCRGGTTAVVSPLIALMKDQVDSLRRNGVPAVRLDSSLTPKEAADAEQMVRRGDARLVFVSPERLVTGFCQNLLRSAGVEHFAIDEAHCISHWGHDFRPEYRQMGRLKELFPGAAVHAYTATATESVRDDICAQLSLADPVVLVGNFDRPNLTYRVVPRTDPAKQIREVLARHPGEAGVIYCLSRKSVEENAEVLKRDGVKAVAYHAGMSPEDRRKNQEAFTSEAADVVVATVAFGMGIDRPDVRFVLHANMPKSLEHYQQEAGRAGRDGQPAECVLLYSGGDVPSLKRMIDQSANDGGAAPGYVESAYKHLEEMARYCRGAVCRHRALVRYFGQEYAKENCEACDLCLGETDVVADSAVIAQKIVSCVARVKEGFGVGHVVSVLRGETIAQVTTRGHDQLSTFGLLKDVSKVELRDWVYQLVGQGALVQTDGDYPLLKLNAESWAVMRGQTGARLVQLPRRARKERDAGGRAEAGGLLTADDQTLFEELRQLRRQLAADEGVPPYIIFHDSVLQELARVRPRSTQEFALIPKVGEAKVRQYAPAFLQAIVSHGPRPAGDGVPPAPPAAGPRGERKRQAQALFRDGTDVEDVMHQTGLSRSTVYDYLAEWVKLDRPGDVRTWVPHEVYRAVEAAAKAVGAEKLKPIFEHLNGGVSYDHIRVSLAHLQISGAIS